MKEMILWLIAINLVLGLVYQIGWAIWALVIWRKNKNNKFGGF